MTIEQFTYWLQGFFELSNGEAFTKREQIIKDHLQEVFLKITPNRNIDIEIQRNLGGSSKSCGCNHFGVFSCSCYCHMSVGPGSNGNKLC